MGIKTSARQFSLHAVGSFTFADLAAGVNPLADLPGNAEVISGEIVVDTAWNSTTNTLEIGDDGDSNRYAAAIDLKTAGRTALVPTGYKYTAPNTVDGTYAETGAAPTQGAARYVIEYILLNDRAHETQPDSAD